MGRRVKSSCIMPQRDWCGDVTSVKYEIIMSVCAVLEQANEHGILDAKWMGSRLSSLSFFFLLPFSHFLHKQFAHDIQSSQVSLQRYKLVGLVICTN